MVAGAPGRPLLRVTVIQFVSEGVGPQRWRPIPSPDRFGPSTLVEAGEQKFLIDAGRGATIRLHQLKIPVGSIDVQLLTHYHSDHTSGIPDVWLTGGLQSYFGTRKTPYRIIGPTGARALME